MTKLCIYHGNCIDGLMAAAVVSITYPETCEFYAAKYNEPPPVDLCKGKEVIIVDFSYPAPDLLLICYAAVSVLVLDHHKTAEAALKDLKHSKLHVEFDMQRSGAGMAWDYFKGVAGGERPRLINMVQDRDLWQFKIDGSKDLHYVLCTEEMTPKHFGNLLLQEQQAGLFVDMLIGRGQAMAKQFASQIQAMKKESFEREIDGSVVPVANVPYLFASELAGELAEGKPFAATYFFNGKEFYVSLRSRGDGRDVSEIAKKFGGGGHKNAAAFKCGQREINSILKEAAHVSA